MLETRQKTEEPTILQSIGLRSLTGLNGPAPEPQVELTPAVNPQKSVTDVYIVCLEDGKKLKMLKRYLARSYDMTPEQYRAKWGLPHEYPMVAPGYARKRQELAKKIGLGRKKGPPEPGARNQTAKAATRPPFFLHSLSPASSSHRSPAPFASFG